MRQCSMARQSYSLHVAALAFAIVLALSGRADCDEKAVRTLAPLVRVIDLDVGESQEVTLCNGRKVPVKLVGLNEIRDSVRDAVRRAEVMVEVDGRSVKLVSANYNLPTRVGEVQIDCSITSGAYTNTNSDHWGLDKAARLRLWPADSPLLEPDAFLYPVKQRWFASGTQMGNEPSFIDGIERPSVRKIYYHSGEDIGGAEGLVEVVAATDALVVSSGLKVLDGHENRKDRETPVAERYDVVYLLDGHGWYYRYSHLYEIDPQIVPGRVIRKSDRLGLLGKEGGSGGWSHLHFEIKSRQPSGKWGTQASYAFLWEAYRRQHGTQLQAVARPHHLLFAGETAVLDGSKSWSESGRIARYEWLMSDGTRIDGQKTSRTYPQTGEFSEVLRVTDAAGRVDYDFVIVQVVDRDRAQELPPSIHAVYYPTFGIQPGDAVTFKVRTFYTTDGKERWDFGDGSSPVEVQSDGNVEQHAKDGYAVTEHRFARPGHYLVRVVRSNARGETATAHLQVRVGQEEPSSALPELTKKLAAGQAVKIVCLGDSVTGVYYHTGGRRAYPELIPLALEKSYPGSKVTLVNAGISGNSTIDALKRLQADVLDHKPDLVTVMFGLNDMVRVPIAEYQANLKTIIERCRAAGAEVLLCTPNAVIESGGRPTAKLLEFCAAMKETGRELNVPVCDCYATHAALRERDPLAWRLTLSDAIHPNMDGHKLTAAAIGRSISGQDVTLGSAMPLQPAIPRTLARLNAKEPLRVLAMPPFDGLFEQALRSIQPEANVEMTAWPTADQTLAKIEEAAKAVRAKRYDLVLVAVPASVTPSSAGPSEEAISSYSWILNWSLSFGRQEWDVVGIAPSVIKADLTPDDQAADVFARRMIAAQDLSVIARSRDDKAPAEEILEEWLRGQFK
ncbi:MAG: PKD domain-containing protein [Planctomycetia bacterium]|nr:PKD domain-containing protein [Planctomycetia bacterium]